MRRESNNRTGRATRVRLRAAARSQAEPAAARSSSSRRFLRDRIAPGVRVLFVGINPGIRSAEIGHHFAGYSNRFWKLLHDAHLVPEPIGTEDDGRLPEWGYGITNLIRRPTPGIGDLRRDEYEAGRARLVALVRKYRPEVVALVGVTLYRTLFPHAAAASPVTGGPRLGRGSRHAAPQRTVEQASEGVALSRRRGRGSRPGAPEPTDEGVVEQASEGVALSGRRGRASDRPVAHPVRLGLQADTLGGARVFVLPNPSGRNANYSYPQMLAAFSDLRRYLLGRIS